MTEINHRKEFIITITCLIPFITLTLLGKYCYISSFVFLGVLGIIFGLITLSFHIKDFLKERKFILNKKITDLEITEEKNQNK